LFLLGTYFFPEKILSKFGQIQFLEKREPFPLLLIIEARIFPRDLRCPLKIFSGSLSFLSVFPVFSVFSQFFLLSLLVRIAPFL
jgi:hypothetical protein